MKLKFKNVTVVGSKISAKGAVKLLKKIEAKIKLTTLSTLNKEDFDILNLVEEYESGIHTKRFIKDQDLIVVSPGVSKNSPVFRWAQEENIPVISEIELAYNFCDSFIIGITGTNGKTTTTYFLEKVLKKFKISALSCGNIGLAFSSVVSSGKKVQVICLELSSFQLENIINFRPRIGVILNITPDHLNRYKDFESYVGAKFNLFKNQKESDFSLLNFNCSLSRRKARSLNSRVIFFKDSPKINENISAILAILNILGIDEKKALSYLREFSPPPHRLEFVANIKGVDFYNDSKATNINSTLFSLKNLKRRTILIAGGRDKGQDFTVLKENEVFKKYVEKVVLTGECAFKVKEALQGIKDLYLTQNLEEAVKLAFRLAENSKIDCILLSPMCASFDSFKNFEERGVFFKKTIKALNGEEASSN